MENATAKVTCFTVNFRSSIHLSQPPPMRYSSKIFIAPLLQRMTLWRHSLYFCRFTSDDVWFYGAKIPHLQRRQSFYSLESGIFFQLQLQ